VRVLLYLQHYIAVCRSFINTQCILHSISHLPNLLDDILDKPLYFPLELQVFLHYCNKAAQKVMFVINFKNNEKHIVTLSTSLTFWPPYPTDILRLHMSITIWAYKSHGQFHHSYLTVILNSHISLTAYTPYITDILSFLISPTVRTLIHPLMQWLSHWLCDSVNAVRYPP
jgi:hypothetical protein